MVADESTPDGLLICLNCTYAESIKALVCAEVSLVAIELVTVVLKLASSPIAAASSFSVFKAPGAASIKLLICEVTNAESAKSSLVYFICLD